MADGRLELEIVTPARRVLSQAVDEVRAPGWDGLFGVRPGHTPFLARMRAGELVARVGKGHDAEELVFAVGEGFVQVAEDKVVVLAATAERADEIDVERAEKELETEGRQLGSEKEGTPGYEHRQAHIERASVRIAVAKRRG